MLDDEKFKQYIDELWQDPCVQTILNEYYQLKYEHYNNCLTWLSENQLLAHKDLLFPAPIPLPPLSLNGLWKVNADNTISSQEIIDNPLSAEKIVNYNINKVKTKVGGFDNIEKISKLTANDQLLIGLQKNGNDDFYKITLFNIDKINYNSFDTIDKQHIPSPNNMYTYNTAEKELHKLKGITFLTKEVITHTQIRDNEIILKLNNKDTLYHHDACFQATNQTFINKLTTMITNNQMNLQQKTSCIVRKQILAATQPSFDVANKLNSSTKMLRAKILQNKLQTFINQKIAKNTRVMPATTVEDFSEYLHYQNIRLYKEKLLNTLLTQKITDENSNFAKKLELTTQQQVAKTNSSLKQTKRKQQTDSSLKQTKRKQQTTSHLLIPTLVTADSTTNYQNKTISNTSNTTSTMPCDEASCSTKPPMPKQAPTSTEMNWELFKETNDLPKTLTISNDVSFDEARIGNNFSNTHHFLPTQEEINEPTNVSSAHSQQKFSSFSS